jgi:hypothetical protein
MTRQVGAQTIIEIRPEVTMLSVLRHLNYKVWFAMAEFIDNAIQSFIANRELLGQTDGIDYQLRVDIKIESSGPGLIIITDNAAGISEADFPRAFRAAQAPVERGGLSEFGMGMKSAACWFADSWSVRTKSIGDPTERTINFDVQHIVDNRIESLSTTVLPVEMNAHYTVVTLKKLHHLPQGGTTKKIKDHLASIYRVYIRDKRLVLKFNGDPLVYDSPTILMAVPYESPGIPRLGGGSQSIKWRKDINLDFGLGHRVTGFAALREKGSTQLAGFALFRRDRLIEGSHDETYRPSYIFKQTNSYPYQRLFGELHIEGFDVSHTKDGFRWGEYEEIFLEYLREALDESPIKLLTQADNYRALPSRQGIEQRATLATTSVAAYVKDEIEPLLVEAREQTSQIDAIPTSLLSDSLTASEQIVEIDDGLYRWIISLRTSVDPADEQWLSIAQADGGSPETGRTRRLSLDVSLAHPFSTRYLGPHNENVEVLLRFGTALAISLIVSQDLTGEPPETVLHHLNNLLRGALSAELRP